MTREVCIWTVVTGMLLAAMRGVDGTGCGHEVEQCFQPMREAILSQGVLRHQVFHSFSVLQDICRAADQIRVCAETYLPNCQDEIPLRKKLNELAYQCGNINETQSVIWSGAMESYRRYADCISSVNTESVPCDVTRPGDSPASKCTHLEERRSCMISHFSRECGGEAGRWVGGFISQSHLPEFNSLNCAALGRDAYPNGSDNNQAEDGPKGHAGDLFSHVSLPCLMVSLLSSLIFSRLHRP